MPEYSRLRTTLSRPLPRDLVTQEQGEAFGLRRKDIQDELRGRPYWPPEDQPLFTTLLVPSQGGMLTIVLPDRPAPCLPVFSTPFKAADYLLLGQLAVALQDRSLLAEAKAFLRFLKLGPWERKLADVQRSASPDFEGPAWPSESRGRGPMGGWT